MIEKSIKINNNKIRYLEGGNSENILLLLHGLGILGGILLVSFFYNPESLFMPR